MNTPYVRDLEFRPIGPRASYVSWPAIFAGAIASIACALIILGIGAQWQSAFAMSVVTALLGVQIICSCIGGYVTGRLTTRWSGISRDEAYFWDTANGFTSWAVFALLGASASRLSGLPILADIERAFGGISNDANLFTSLWVFVALLSGAFCASLCATFGGRARDRTGVEVS